jgi:hypothetical protein
MVKIFIGLFLLLFLFPNCLFAKMEIGMNIGTVTYSTPLIVFTDVMKTADDVRLYTLPSGPGVGNNRWEDEVTLDGNGYALELPYNDGSDDFGALIYFSNWYSGEYVLLYDGTGTITIGGVNSVVNGNGNLQITLTGIGSNAWMTISASTSGDYVKNMRIVPVAYELDQSGMPTFHADFLGSVANFKVLRFMDSVETNNSVAEDWADRIATTHYSQGQNNQTTKANGMSWDYVIEISNELNVDIWINIPHKATDDYIDSLATLLLNDLEAGRNVYVEYSNEVWNGLFDQKDFVADNAPGHQNAYVSTDLAAISGAGTFVHKKNAYMTKRVWDRFYTIWSGSTSRIVRVGTAQLASATSAETYLDYLYDTIGGAADVFAITAYTGGIQADQHAIWNADPGSVTAAAVVSYISGRLSVQQGLAEAVKVYADERSLPLVAYEGGGGFPPYQSASWDYNQAVWDGHILYPDVYNLVTQNLENHAQSSVGATLMVAFSLCGTREQIFGSWGFLETMTDYDDPSVPTVAPKYKALLDYISSPAIEGITIN